MAAQVFIILGSLVFLGYIATLMFLHIQNKKEKQLPTSEEKK